MIPKIIHYCWFGGNPKTMLIKKCIKSWKKYCPDYEIIEWNESNFDLNCCDYVKEAYESKKWAFVTDYARLKIINDNGGIYLDTDVELLKPLDKFLKYDSFFGYEDKKHIATGLGFGSIKNNPILRALMNDYENIKFIKDDNSYDLTSCPVRNTATLEKLGLVRNGETFLLNNNAFFSAEYFSPIDYTSGYKNITDNTVSIHWFNASWQSKETKAKHKKIAKKIRRKNLIHKLIHIPNVLLRKILGDDKYEELKKKLKG